MNAAAALSWFGRAPALRLDVRFVPQGENVRIYEETSQRYVLLYQLECHLAQLMDGRRNLDELTIVAQQFNPEITRELVEQLVIQLNAAGLLTPISGGRPKISNDGLIKWQTGNAPQHRAPIIAPIAFDDLDSATEIRPQAADEQDSEIHRETEQRFAELMIMAPPDLDESEEPLLAKPARPAPPPARPVEVAHSAAQMRAVTAGGSEQPVFDDSPIPDDIVFPPPQQAFDESPIPDDIVFPPAAPGALSGPTVMPAQPAEALSAEMVAAQEQEVLLDGQRVRWYQRRSVKALAVLALLIGVSAVVPYPLRVTSDCTIIPSERVKVRTEIQGVLAQILVDEGQTVKKGDVIARIDDRALKADRLKVLAEIEKLEAELVTLQKGRRPEEIQQQAAVLAARRTEAAFAAKQAQRRNQMAREGVGSKQQAEDASRDLQTKMRSVAEADAALRLLKAGSRPEEIASKQAVIKRAKVELEFIDQKLTTTVIRAPIDGEVLTPRFRERLNEAVEAGGLVCEIANTKRMRAEIHVPQRFVDAIEVGMPAIVKVESYPSRPFEGKVDFIAPAADDAEGRRVRVVVELDNNEALLKTNMTGYGEVEAGDRPVLELATRRITRWIRVRFLL